MIETLPADGHNLVLTLLAGFAGGLLRGYSGFGFAMAAVPIMALGVPPLVAVPVVLIHELLIGIISILAERLPLRAKELLPISLGSVLGTPIGVVALSNLPAEAMRLTIAAVVAVAVVALWRMRKAHFGLSAPVLSGAGFFSGLLNGATALSGPPAILVVLGSPLGPHAARALLIQFIALSAALGIVLTMVGGLQGAVTVTLALTMVPAVALGFLVGVVAFRRLPHEHYRAISLSGLFLIALFTLGAAVFSQ
ncbi:MAG: sulfite exporter TauE/SafE family protein [Pseudomonadota bacterium]